MTLLSLRGKIQTNWNEVCVNGLDPCARSIRFTALDSAQGTDTSTPTSEAASRSGSAPLHHSRKGSAGQNFGPFELLTFPNQKQAKVPKPKSTTHFSTRPTPVVSRHLLVTAVLVVPVLQRQAAWVQSALLRSSVFRSWLTLFTQKRMPPLPSNLASKAAELLPLVQIPLVSLPMLTSPYHLQGIQWFKLHLLQNHQNTRRQSNGQKSLRLGLRHPQRWRRGEPWCQRSLRPQHLQRWKHRNILRDQSYVQCSRTHSNIFTMEISKVRTWPLRLWRMPSAIKWLQLQHVWRLRVMLRRSWELLNRKPKNGRHALEIASLACVVSARTRGGIRKYRVLRV